MKSTHLGLQALTDFSQSHWWTNSQLPDNNRFGESALAAHFAPVGWQALCGATPAIGAFHCWEPKQFRLFKCHACMRLLERITAAGIPENDCGPDAFAIAADWHEERSSKENRRAVKWLRLMQYRLSNRCTVWEGFGSTAIRQCGRWPREEYRNMRAFCPMGTHNWKCRYCPQGGPDDLSANPVAVQSWRFSMGSCLEPACLVRLFQELMYRQQYPQSLGPVRDHVYNFAHSLAVVGADLPAIPAAMESIPMISGDEDEYRASLAYHLGQLHGA